MSGQPYINPLDPAKFRKQYLANLALQSSINDMNLQANKLYTRTGVTSQITDNRTTSEKQADLYRLRIEVRNKLSEIADGANADKIVQQLDDSQLIFLSDQLEYIVNDLKNKYRTGILAEIFITYFEKYMDTYQRTQGVDSGLQQETGDRILLNQQLIMENMASKSDVNDIDDAIRKLGVENTYMGRAIRQNLANIEQVLDNLPETMETLNSAGNALTKGQIQSTLNDIVKDLPTKQELNDLLRQLLMEQGRNNSNGIQIILNRIQELTDAGGDIVGEVQVLQQLLAQSKEEQGVKIGIPSISIGNTIEDFEFRSRTGSKFRYINPSTINVKGKPTKSELDLYLTFLVGIIPNLFFGSGQTPTSVKQNKQNTINFLSERDDNIRKELSRLMQSQSSIEAVAVGRPVKEERQMSAKGIKVGRGLVRPIDKPTKRSDVLVADFDIDYSAGLIAQPRFVPFGKFVIHKNKIANNIIAIKRPAGSAIAEFPSKRVSRALGGVIRKMVGGKIPTFDEIDKLDKDEREYLHHLATKSQLIDKLNIPTPKKDEDETDINQFEVMRGQILAGNDSIDLVKKFKQLILRMSDKGLIPRRQVKELLIMLTENGY